MRFDAVRPGLPRTGLAAAISLVAVLSASGAARADVDDPLHGYCAGAGQCIDNGTNSPTTYNPPSNFGFTVSPGPASGDLVVDILIPNNDTHPASFALTGSVSATATLFSSTAWTSGQLDAYLGISASPTNAIGAYLPSTQASGVDPGATGFFVYQANLGSMTLQGSSNPNVFPLENIGGTLGLGSYIVGFFNEGSDSGIIATANSGAIFEDGNRTPVPEPITLSLFGAGLVGAVAMRRRKKA